VPRPSRVRREPDVLEVGPHRRRQARRRLPAAGERHPRDGRDPLLTRDTAEKLFAAYRGTASAVDPRISPVLADFGRGFVPTMITTGTRDLLQSDAVRFTRVLRDATVPVRLRVWEGMWHAFESVPGLPEGNECMAEVFGFLDGHL